MLSNDSHFHSPLYLSDCCFFFILVIFLALFDLGYPPVSWKSADLQDWEQSRTGVQ